MKTVKHILLPLIIALLASAGYAQPDMRRMNISIGIFTASATAYDYEGAIGVVGSTGFTVDDIQPGDMMWDDVSRYRVDSVEVIVAGTSANVWVTDLYGSGGPQSGKGTLGQPTANLGLQPMTENGSNFITEAQEARVSTDNLRLLDSLIGLWNGIYSGGDRLTQQFTTVDFNKASQHLTFGDFSNPTNPGSGAEDFGIVMSNSFAGGIFIHQSTAGQENEIGMFPAYVYNIVQSSGQYDNRIEVNDEYARFSADNTSTGTSVKIHAEVDPSDIEGAVNMVQLNSNYYAYGLGVGKDLNPFLSEFLVPDTGFVVQSIIGTSLAYNWIKVKLNGADTTGNQVSFYNESYALPNAVPPSDGNAYSIQWMNGVAGFSQVGAGADGNGIITALPAGPVSINASGNGFIIDSIGTTLKFTVTDGSTVTSDLLLPAFASLPVTLSQITAADTSQINIRAGNQGINLYSTGGVYFNTDTIGLDRTRTIMPVSTSQTFAIGTYADISSIDNQSHSGIFVIKPDDEFEGVVGLSSADPPNNIFSSIQSYPGFMLIRAAEISAAIADIKASASTGASLEYSFDNVFDKNVFSVGENITFSGYDDFANNWQYNMPKESPNSADSLSRAMVWDHNAPSFRMVNDHTYRSASVPGNILLSDDYIEVITTGDTLFLPPPVAGIIGKQYTIIAGGTHGGANTSAIAVRDRSATIELAASILLDDAYENYTLVCNGSQWIIISDEQRP